MFRSARSTQGTSVRTRSPRANTSISISAPNRTVARPRLLRRLDAAARGKLTLVVAPRGYGKSVLLDQWASTRQDLTALLSLEGVAAPRELASLLVEPLAGLDAALIDLQLFSYETGERSLGKEFLGRLVDVYDSLPHAVLVIDCLDGLQSLALREEMLAFFAQTGPQVHFVVALRSARAERQVARDDRIRDEVAYIREVDLTFDRDEARDLLRIESRRRLDDADVETLVSRSEGWPIGLHLAALSLRAAADVPAWVDAFGGADEYVGSYFTDVMMPEYSAATQRFLLTTCVLDYLTASLCDAVTGTNDGAQMLHLLAEQSVLRRRTDGGNEVFVHRRLFGEYLRHQLCAAEPDTEQRVLCRAADWYVEHDDFEQAVRYLIAARQWERVLDAVAGLGRAMHEQGRPAVALAWLEAVPESIRTGRSAVTLQHAVLRDMARDTLGAEEILRRLGESQSLPPGFRAVADVLRASWVETHISPDAAVDAADTALGLLDSLRADELPDVFGLTSHGSLRVIASLSRARAIWYRGDVTAARAEMEHLLENGDLYPTWHINALGTLALLESWTGPIGRAEQHATYAFRIAAESRRPDTHPALVHAYLAMSHVLLLRNDLRRVEPELGEAFEAAVRTRRYSVPLAIHAVERAHFELASSRPRAALESLRETNTWQPVLPPLIAARRRAMTARALLGLGEAALAERALDLEATDSTIEVVMSAVQLALARHDIVSARRLLAEWPDDGESWSELNYILAQALTDDADGNRRDALAAVEQVVAAAEPEGHVLLFVDAGPGMQRLLRALFRSRPTSYLRQLVRPEQAAPPRAGTRVGDLVAPLSERELVVLRYLTSRMTHAEIAAQLFVSLNTVKSHVRSIYSKLGAHGRRDAIDRAEALGLV